MKRVQVALSAAMLVVAAGVIGPTLALVLGRKRDLDDRAMFVFVWLVLGAGLVGSFYIVRRLVGGTAPAKLDRRLAKVIALVAFAGLAAGCALGVSWSLRDNQSIVPPFIALVGDGVLLLEAYRLASVG